MQYDFVELNLAQLISSKWINKVVVDGGFKKIIKLYKFEQLSPEITALTTMLK